MRKIFLAVIKLYQNYISPLSPPSCRFYPTCSEYSYQSIQKHGIFKGGLHSVIRVGKCHPFHEGGVDPVK